MMRSDSGCSASHFVPTPTTNPSSRSASGIQRRTRTSSWCSCANCNRARTAFLSIGGFFGFVGMNAMVPGGAP
jgi:hypothetical protein